MNNGKGERESSLRRGSRSGIRRKVDDTVWPMNRSTQKGESLGAGTRRDVG